MFFVGSIVFLVIEIVVVGNGIFDVFVVVLYIVVVVFEVVMSFQSPMTLWLSF